MTYEDLINESISEGWSEFDPEFQSKQVALNADISESRDLRSHLIDKANVVINSVSMVWLFFMLS